MNDATYELQRGKVEAYFDRTAADTWARLTSDAPVSGIRATVRAGRERMRAEFLSRLPADMRDQRVLDAGCGTGAMAVEMASRGAEVIGVDLAESLIDVANERLPREGLAGTISLRAGDMLDPSFGTFDYVVSMDCLIHYAMDDAVDAVAMLAERTRRSILFTFAPRTPLLAIMHTAGRLFPRGDRSPAITPVREDRLRSRLKGVAALQAWNAGESVRVASGFYTSELMVLTRR
ncbi:MAG: magnesium protoporphyrin IX methyltransferase [Pseudomonadota bacterium]